MFKELLTFVFALVCVSECTLIKVSPYIPQDEFGVLDKQFLRSTDDISSKWVPHIKDFLKLINVEKMVMVAMQYMADPEVMMFMKFVLSPQFKELIWDFEMMKESKEAFYFLKSKGYDMETVINFVNAAFNLPPIRPNYVLRNKKGISGFFEAMLDDLPMEDMKKLFESKLETSPEVADLFATINSEEFMDIMRRMRENPKFAEFKMIFEGYGFDFEFLCKLIKEIFGDYYQGVFCE